MTYQPIAWTVEVFGLATHRPYQTRTTCHPQRSICRSTGQSMPLSTHANISSIQSHWNSAVQNNWAVCRDDSKDCGKLHLHRFPIQQERGQFHPLLVSPSKPRTQTRTTSWRWQEKLRWPRNNVVDSEKHRPLAPCRSTEIC